VTRYQWLVLAIASAGWIFDVFEGQLIVAVGNQEALPALLRGSGLESRLQLIFNASLAAFLLGGAVGGVTFGMMADRLGRGRTMVLTILVYSLFTALTAFTQSWWQLMVLRFLVGLGVGGEWAVAAAIVAEVFPARARPAASGIFHASSVLGTYLATLVGLIVVRADPESGWRYAFVLGLLPALLTLWVRAALHEPASWREARAMAGKDARQGLGRLRDLFQVPTLRRHTLIGTALAVIGLATFWGAHIRGKDLLRAAVAQRQQDAGVVDTGVQKNYEMLGMFLATTGGGIGLLSFVPVSQRAGRRPAFFFFHAGGFVLTLLLCALADSVEGLLIVLPFFGFFTLGMHAGYAVYFPELFPTRLRGTGAGFCFNTARILACPALLGFAWLQDGPLSLTLATSVAFLGGLYLVGAALALLGPETRGQPLPE
jgi:MFS family permease